MNRGKLVKTCDIHKQLWAPRMARVSFALRSPFAVRVGRPPAPSTVFQHKHKMDVASLIDHFEIGCPCCQVEYQVYFVTGVPPPPQRNSQSDPKGELHRELMQCQFCFKSRREGITFFRCGGCQIEIYCVRDHCHVAPFLTADIGLSPSPPSQSKECQKKAWSRHKEKCALNRKYQPLGGGEPKPVKDLRAFTSKHRPTISEAASTALEVAKDPKRAQDYVFVIYLRPRPSSTRAETSFFAFGAAVVPFSAFSNEQVAEMKGQLKSAHDLNVRNGSLGAMEVVLMCLDPNVVNVVMMGFSDDPSPLDNPGDQWKHWLLHRLNDGIVC